MRPPFLRYTIALTLVAASAAGAQHLTPARDTTTPPAAKVMTPVIRTNQIGYRPAGMKVAVTCVLQTETIASFTVEDDAGRVVYGPAPAAEAKPFGPCTRTYRLDFSALRTPGRYRVTATGPDVRVASRTLRIGDDVYDESVEEVVRLVQSAGVRRHRVIKGRRSHPDPKLYAGSGKMWAAPTTGSSTWSTAATSASVVAG